MEVKFNNNNGPKSQICLYKRRPQLSKTLFKCLTRVSLSHPRDLPSLPVLGSLACGVTLTLVQQIFFFFTAGSYKTTQLKSGAQDALN